MKNKKQTLRIGTLLAILMFLLIPLLSSPVAAAFSQYLGSVYTANGGGGSITVSGSISTPATVVDNAPWNIDFDVDYDYNDNDPLGSGSDHWMVVNVSWQPGGTGGWSGPNTYTQTKIYITAGGGQVTGTYTTPLLTGYGGRFTNFLIDVTVYCDDLSGSGPASWSSTGNTMSIR